jgi:hypothetical protein
MYVHGCQEAHNTKWVCGPADLTMVYGEPFFVKEDPPRPSPISPPSSGTDANKVTAFEKSRMHVKSWMEKEMKLLRKQ